MPPPVRRFRRPTWAQLTIGVLPMLTAACSLATSSFGTLEGLTVREVSQSSSSSEDFNVRRAGAVQRATVGMSIKKGDTLVTSRTTRVLIAFRAGYEVTLDTGTAIVIENPSIFIRLGQLFLKKLGVMSDSFPVNTNHVSIADSSTRFLVKVPRPDSVVVLVDQGLVKVRSKERAWSQRVYGELQGGVIVSAAVPVATQRLTRQQMDGQIRWVGSVDSLTRTSMPSLQGKTEQEARDELQRAGLRLLFVMTRTTGNAPPGRVADQSVPAGTRLSRQSYVTMTIEKQADRAGAGPGAGAAGTGAAATGRVRARASMPVRRCVVPEIRNRGEKEALRILSDSGFTGRKTANYGTDYVATQDPAYGTERACGSVVDYTTASNIKE